MIDELKVGHHVALAIGMLARLSTTLKNEKNKKVIREAMKELRIAIDLPDKEKKK